MVKVYLLSLKGQNLGDARKLLEGIYHILKDSKTFHEMEKIAEFLVEVSSVIRLVINK